MALEIPLPSPNVMVPKQSLETRRPVLPSVAYCMTFCLFMMNSFKVDSAHSCGGAGPILVGRNTCVLCPLGAKIVTRAVGHLEQTSCGRDSVKFRQPCSLARSAS